MDVIKAFRDYLTKMVSDVEGIKVLLLDNETVSMVSLVYSQTEILQKEVFLVEKITKAGRTKMRNLNAVVFVRPTSKSVDCLIEELRDPKYKNYYIFFSNIVRLVHIEKLAEADSHAVVKEVQEFFGDFYPINRDLFSLNLTNIIGEHLGTWDSNKFERTCEGLVSVLLALKKRPVIRFEKNSDMARRLAKEVNYIMQQESSLFDVRVTDSPPLLLILDRRNDPVTPLLNQWTYQAMIHELLEINNNLVESGNFETKIKETPQEAKEGGTANNDTNIVLSSYQDSFFQKNMYLNFGDLGANIKEYVDEYRIKTKSTASIESIDDIKRFVQEYPQFRQLAGNVSKHVSLVSELSQRVDKDLLLDVSELEQDMSSSEDHNEHIKKVYQILANPKISNHNKLRVALLYSLRYETNRQNDIAGVTDKLISSGVSHDSAALVSGLTKYAGVAQRQLDLFGNESLIARGKNKLIKGLQGVENIFTQHQPLLVRTLDLILKSKSKDRDVLFPYVEVPEKDRPQDVIIFIVGGATYEEAKVINNMNSTPGVRFVLGGTTIHNSKSFVNELQTTLSRVK